jgi:predicted nucleic acid-binding protein
MGLILDTSAIVALERAWVIGSKLPVRESERLIMPAIVWAEALVGVRRADSEIRAANRLAVLQRIRRIIGIEPFTVETAEHYAYISAELSADGLMIPQNDISVAATARSLGFGVLVGPKDEAHFRRVKGLEVRVMED